MPLQALPPQRPSPSSHDRSFLPSLSCSHPECVACRDPKTCNKHSQTTTYQSEFTTHQNKTTHLYDTVCYSQSYIPHLSIVNSLPSNFHFGIKLLAVQTQLTVVKIINISTYTFMEYKSNTSQKV